MAIGNSPAAEQKLEGGTTVPKTKIVAEPGVAQVVVTRVFDAPRERVFEVLTDPAQIPHWWGPKQYTTVVDTMDARPGGSWRYVQRNADGAEFSFRGVYHDVVAPERLINTFEFEQLRGHVALETVTLEDVTGRTRMTNRTVFQTLEDRDGMIASGMESGAVETWERLAELVESDPGKGPGVAALARSK